MQPTAIKKERERERALYAHYLFMPNACAIKICELVTKSI